MFWNNADSFIRVLVLAPAAYAALIVILRVSGKRMLSKMNAFDLVVTIALGSTLATIILNQNVALADGLAALALLIGLQFAVAWCAARVTRFNRLIKAEPTLLFYRGEFLAKTLRAENVAEDGIRAAIRQQGYGSLDDIEAAVLESDGSLSIVGRSDSKRAPTILGVPTP